MGKKYLLYIHDEKFDLEKEKSRLVNQLLGVHYAGAGRQPLKLNGSELHTRSGETRRATEEKSQEQQPASVEGNICPHNMIWGACGYASCKKK